ncbi:unnamed protein product [Lepidochelys olivacea]
MSSRVSLTCHTEGGYPEVSVLWLDRAGNNVTTESNTTLHRDPSGLCDVSSQILLPRGESSNYTWLLQSPGQPCIIRHLTVSCSPGSFLCPGLFNPCRCPQRMETECGDTTINGPVSSVK